MRVAIIGAGAAGCFCAVNLKRLIPEADICIYESSRRPLTKVAITGGGRCNITNTFRDIANLSQAYPRGWRLMQRLFRTFSPEQTQRWWENEGVSLVVQDDQCIFPRSQSAMQVVNTLLQLLSESNVRIITEARVTSITHIKNGNAYLIESSHRQETYDAVVVTTGGSPKLQGLDFLTSLNIDIVTPVPSLFAFDISDEHLHELTGIVVEDCHVGITGTRFNAEGPLLITHFGMSGPAILKLSSYAARYLAEEQYMVTISVNWMLGENEEEVRMTLLEFTKTNRRMGNLHPEHLTSRHWSFLLMRASIPEEHRWNSLNKKEINRLVTTLTSDCYTTNGRRAYKSEFVTCGGVSLQSINPNTLASKEHPGIFFAGEILDIDAITGGFNLQAAWTMGYIVAQSIATRKN